MSQRKLHISPDLSLPLDTVTQTAAILAKRRVGKTYTGSVIAEEMVKAGLPFVAIDPTGAWWGLRASADGKSEGLPVTIIGGTHGDIPLEPTAGKLIAELVVDTPGFYIIDLSATASNAEQDRFAADFAERLYRYKEQHREPLHLFVDEADSFAPQRPMDGQQRMLGAFEALIRRGGIRGIGMTMITQRPAVLNKNVLTQAEMLIVLQMTAPQDQDAIDEWVKRNGTKEERDTMMASLASLQRGQAWVWSPAWLETFKLVQIRERHTFNSSATPKAGEKVITPRKLAAVDIESFKDRMAATIEQIKQNDPAELKKKSAAQSKRIAELEKQLQQPVAPAAILPAPEPVEVMVLPEEQIKHIEEMLHQFDLKLDHAIKVLETELSGLDTIRGIIDGMHDRLWLTAKGLNTQRAVLQPAGAGNKASRPALPPARTNPTPQPRPAAAPAVEGITAPRQRILDALAWLETVRINQADKTQLAFLADASPTSSGYTNNLGSLRSAGLIEYPSGGKCALTDAGRAISNYPQIAISTDTLQQAVLSKLPRPKAAILRALIDVFPESLSKDELAQRSNQSITSSGYTNNLGSLRSLGLISYPESKTAKAAPILFID